MKKLFILVGLILLASISFASPPSRVATYTPGDTITSDDVTNNEDAIFNYLSGGVDTIKDGTIVNADVSNSANIQAEKLNLTAVNQNIANTGTFANTGNMTITGALAVSGNITSSDTGDVGWSVQSGANTACNTTCTSGCGFGQDSGDTNNIVACDDATADTCLCLGGS